MMLTTDKDLMLFERKCKSLSSWNHTESLFYTIEVMMSSCMMTERKPNGNVILQLEISLLKVYSTPHLYEVMMLAKYKDLKKIIVQLESS